MPELIMTEHLSECLSLYSQSLLGAWDYAFPSLGGRAVHCGY